MGDLPSHHLSALEPSLNIQHLALNQQSFLVLKLY